MRYLVCLLLVACASATVTVTPTDDLDSRICAAAEQVPWQGPVIAALVTDPATPIQNQAAATVQAQNTGSANDALAEWDALTKLCVDSGF